MTTIAEAFKTEMHGRLKATPLIDYGPNAPAAREIRRSHLTTVDREKAPAIYLRFGKARRTDDRPCAWKWEMQWTASIYVRSDNDQDADPILEGLLARLDPLATAYGNGVELTLDEVESDTEIADTDAQRVDVKGTAKFQASPWSLAPVAP